jgi:hypothetical protein
LPILSNKIQDFQCDSGENEISVVEFLVSNRGAFTENNLNKL